MGLILVCRFQIRRQGEQIPLAHLLLRYYVGGGCFRSSLIYLGHSPPARIFNIATWKASGTHDMRLQKCKTTHVLIVNTMSTSPE